MTEQFKRLANSLNWKPIETLPWQGDAEGYPEFSLPLGLMIRLNNGRIVLIGTDQKDRTHGCDCCSESYTEFGDDDKWHPRLPFEGAIEWAWINEELGKDNQ